MKITVETVVNADMNDVWKAWNNPDDIVQWNSPHETWHTTRSAVDLREGGDRRRLPSVEVGIVVHLPIDELRKQIHACLALGHSERATIHLAKLLRQCLQLLGVMHECLHFLFSRHRPKSRQHLCDRRREC